MQRLPYTPNHIYCTGTTSAKRLSMSSEWKLFKSANRNSVESNMRQRLFRSSRDDAPAICPERTMCDML